MGKYFLVATLVIVSSVLAGLVFFSKNTPEELHVPIQVVSGVTTNSNRSGVTVPTKFTGTILTVKGAVAIGQAKALQTAAKPTMTVGESDTVKTGPGGTATILFADGSLLRLSEKTEVNLASYTKDGDTITILIEQVAGKTWNRVQQLLGKSSYKVETPTMVATVRGTAFGIELSANGSAISVMDGLVAAGAVDRSSGNLTMLDEVSLEKMQTMRVDETMIHNLKINRGKAISQHLMTPTTMPDTAIPDWVSQNLQMDQSILPFINSSIKQELINANPDVQKAAVNELRQKALNEPPILDTPSPTPASSKVTTKTGSTFLNLIAAPTPTPTPPPTVVNSQLNQNINKTSLGLTVVSSPTPTTASIKAQINTALFLAIPTPTPTPVTVINTSINTNLNTRLLLPPTPTTVAIKALIR